MSGGPIPWCSGFLEKLIVARMVMKFTASCGILSSIAVVARLDNWTLPYSFYIITVFFGI
jgi:hypothetical protein